MHERTLAPGECLTFCGDSEDLDCCDKCIERNEIFKITELTHSSESKVKMADAKPLFGAPCAQVCSDSEDQVCCDECLEIYERNL